MAQRKRKSRKHHCPTPTKPGYTNEYFAQAALDDPEHMMFDQDLIAHQKCPRLFHYACDCGKWHLTSKPPLTPSRMRHL